MSPTGGLSGNREVKIMFQLESWARQNGTGITFSCNTGFRLPNGAMRAPDACWVSNVRLAKVSKSEFNKFVPLCPDFVVELQSSTDRIGDLKAKMDEYIANGSLLGLLIIPDKKQVLVYRPGQDIEQIDQADKIACEPVLPGFELDVREVW